MSSDAGSDEIAIHALVMRQFASMSWLLGNGPDAAAFKADFLHGAALFPSARPVRAQTVDEFATRMVGLAGSTLPSFDETVVGTKIIVAGNVAIAAVACQAIENGNVGGLTVEMMLLVKNEDRWKIAAQGWDKVKANQTLPIDLAAISDAS